MLDQIGVLFLLKTSYKETCCMANTLSPSQMITKKVCKWCKKEFVGPYAKVTCSQECKEAHGNVTRLKEEAECHTCKKHITLIGSARVRFLKTGHAYCSKKCSKEYVGSVSQVTLANTNRLYASDRMKARNPMHKQEIIDKMRASLIEIGHQPKVRGGNGRGATEAQTLLHAKLSEMADGEWAMEYVVNTKSHGMGLPHHYKIDIANDRLMIAIEIDGGSHCTKANKEKDKKKQDFLSSRGWSVLRFWNHEVLGDGWKKCVETVMSITSK
jgi:hypothetical protein